jgi:hypothetical protein
MTARTLAILLVLAAAAPAAFAAPAPAQKPPATTPAKPSAEQTSGDAATPVPGGATTPATTTTTAAKPAATTTAEPPPAAKRIAGFDLMTATVMQQRQSSFSGLGGRLRLSLPNTIPGVEVLPTVEYWRNSSTLTPYDIKGTRVDATFGGDVRYAFTAGNWNPYVGGGYAVHFMSTTVNAEALGIVNRSDSVIKGGLTALVGLNFPLTPKIDNFREFKYHHIPDYSQLKFNWGISFGL